MPATNLKFDLEDAALFLRCALTNLRILREGMETDLIAMENAHKFLGTKHMMDYCDAIFSATRELGRIREELEQLVSKAYENERGDEDA